MLKIKIFKADMPDLENQINTWLQENKINIRHIKQSSMMYDTIISIFYIDII